MDESCCFHSVMSGGTIHKIYFIIVESVWFTMSKYGTYQQQIWNNPQFYLSDALADKEWNNVTDKCNKEHLRRVYLYSWKLQPWSS